MRSVACAGVQRRFVLLYFQKCSILYDSGSNQTDNTASARPGASVPRTIRHTHTKKHIIARHIKLPAAHIRGLLSDIHSMHVQQIYMPVVSCDVTASVCLSRLFVASSLALLYFASE